MSSNGHDILKVASRDEDKLPSKLRAYLLEHFDGWEEKAIKVDPPAAYQRPSVDASVDAPNSSVDAAVHKQTEVLKVMVDAGYPFEQIKEVISLIGNKSTDASVDATGNRQTQKDLETLSRRRKRDKDYQVERRKKLKGCSAASVDATVGYISSSLPYSEVDTNKKVRDSGIRAREWFEKFWPVYPKRQGGNPRKPAEDAFTVALKNGHDPERIIAGAEAYALSCKRSNTIGTAYVAHARTWLKQQRWNDDYSDHGGGNARPGPGISTSQPRKENGAQRAYRLKQEALAGQPGGGLSDSAEGLVELDPSEWSSGTQTRANGHGAED